MSVNVMLQHHHSRMSRARVMASCVRLLLLLIAISSGFNLSECTNFTIVNKCQETVWPGITPSENFTNGNLVLQPGESSVVTPPAGWHGRIWGRTWCSFDSKGNDSTCQMGDCGALKCSGPGQSPATIAEFTLGEPDYYDVSLVGGFNLPMVVTPLRGKGNCKTAGCDGDLRKNCPANLTVKDSGGKTIACQSACDAFNMDEYCCRGMYGNPVSCQATNYSTAFKQVCPVAYSYAYDDPTSIITCSASDYVVAFCASRNQTVCTYHNDKLVCNESSGAKTLPHLWWILMLALSSMLD